jgi:glycerol-1-phosphate dehydrogenase [NAD(P)+]
MLQRIHALTGKCPACGKEHALRTAEAYVGPGESTHLAAWLKERGARVCIVADENTYPYARPLAIAAGADVVILPGRAHADEETTDMLLHMPSFCAAELAVACGSGSLHDTVRYTAAERGIPFVSFPTAASVDGFVSGVAAMTWHSRKVSYPSVPPVAVFADDAVYAAAPPRLTASGAADMLGKYTALFDWRAAQVLTGEPVCERIYALEKEALDVCADAIRRRAETDPVLYARRVMEGLILSGLAIQLCGNSRPASGSEHHLSHLWEMHRINPELGALHGEQVGVGLLTVLGVYGLFASRPRLLSDRFLMPDPDVVLDRGRLETVFGPLTDGILEENTPGGAEHFSLCALRVPDRAASERELRAALSALPTRSAVRALLEAAGAPTEISAIGLPADEEFAARSAAFAPYVRNRFTLLKAIEAEKLVGGL